MALKKIESITFRTDKDLKAALLKISEEKKWTLSQLSEEIIRQWLEEKRPELLPREELTPGGCCCIP